LILCIFLVSISALIFIISFCLLIFGLICSCFSESLRCIIGYLIGISPFWSMNTHCYKLSSLLYPKGSGKLCSYFHFFISPLIWWLTDYSTVYCSVSICLNIFWSFFCCWFLDLFYCGKIENGIISIFLYLLRLALCSKVLSVLEKVQWAVEKNVYCATAGWNILYMSGKSFAL
jgi:hypothetical protein